MEKIIIEITLIEIRFKSKENLILNYKPKKYFKKDKDFFNFYNFENKEELEKILKNFKKTLKKNHQIIFTGIGLEFYTETKNMLTNIFGEKKIKILDSLNCTIKTLQKEIKKEKNFIKFDTIMVDQFKNTEKVSKLIKNEKKCEKIKYPLLIIDIRKNQKIYKLYACGKIELLQESLSGESSYLSLQKYLNKFQNLDKIPMNDIMLKHKSYDVDITVGDIYGENCNGVLLKDLIASCMGKNKGDLPYSFLKSFMYSCAIDISHLAALNRSGCGFVLCVTDVVKHKFTDFFICSLLDFYDKLYKPESFIVPCVLKEDVYVCLEFED